MSVNLYRLVKTVAIKFGEFGTHNMFCQESIGGLSMRLYRRETKKLLEWINHKSLN